MNLVDVLQGNSSKGRLQGKGVPRLKKRDKNSEFQSVEVVRV